MPQRPGALWCAHSRIRWSRRIWCKLGGRDGCLCSYIQSGWGHPKTDVPRRSRRHPAALTCCIYRRIADTRVFFFYSSVELFSAQVLPCLNECLEHDIPLARESKALACEVPRQLSSDWFLHIWYWYPFSITRIVPFWLGSVNIYFLFGFEKSKQVKQACRRLNRVPYFRYFLWGRLKITPWFLQLPKNAPADDLRNLLEWQPQNGIFYLTDGHSTPQLPVIMKM